MKHYKNPLIRFTLGILLVASLACLMASIPPTTGTWYLRPDQTFTSSTVVTHGSTYQSAVRPPINADGSSNWPSRRGVIPVQFDLLVAPTTTTTTTKTYDPPVWKSVLSEGWPYTFLQLCLQKDLYGPGYCPDAPAVPALTFNDITNLSAIYNFTVGDCQAGSLRWDVYVQHGADIEVVEVYYGNPNGVPNPPGQSCSGANSESGKNLISDPTLPPNRFEMQGGWGVPGPLYTTYADAVASTNNGTDKVVAVQLTLDSGFAGDQRADVSNVTVNDNTFTPKTTETTTTTTVDGPFANTCTLPAAELRWAKTNPNPEGGINEAESIQPKDTGQFYRQVDCKYIYNLDVTSLDGKGNYTVWVRIGGLNVPVPATFDLK